MSTSIAVPPPRRSAWRHVRRTLYFALALIALLAAIWAGLWHFAAGKAEETIASIIAREASAGRNISCGSRQISGFPFAFTVTCDKPRLEVARPSGKMVLAGQLLTGTTGLGAPGHILVKVEGPLAIEAPGMAEAEAQWRSFTGDIALDLKGLDHADVTVEAPSFRQRNGQSMIASTAELLELHARPDAARPAADEAIAVTGKMSRLVSPILDALTGETSPADGDLDASISRAAALLRPKAGEAPCRRSSAGAWRAAPRGSSTPTFSKGPVKVAVSGDLALDEAHRLSGGVDAALEGIDTLAQRLQIPKIGINIIKMSGGKLRVPADLSDGRVSATLGPVSVTLPVVLLPLY